MRCAAAFAAALAGGLIMLTGGCPVAPAVLGESSVPPGPYYVERLENGLHYYDLPAVRGASGRWVAILSDGEWYSGAGVYVHDERGRWCVDAASAGLTLDDLLQTHDPPPAPPSGE